MDATANLSLAPNQDVHRSLSHEGAIAYSLEDPYATATTIPDASSSDSRGPDSCADASVVFSGPLELRYGGPDPFTRADFLNYYGNDDGAAR